MIRKTEGFTLIELMIVVAVVAILAGIAYPSYQDSGRKSRRADGRGAILQVQLAQEKWRANNTTYGTLENLAAHGITANSLDGYYTITVTDNNATNYTITATATAKGGQSADAACTPLVLSKTGPTIIKTPNGCW